MKSNKRTPSLIRGRFDKDVSTLLKTFSASVNIDKKLALYDIKGSMAHVKMLAKVNLIKAKQKNTILKGLESIQKNILLGKFNWQDEHEDVHMNIEAALFDKIGEDAKALHTARSRNDQVVLDTFLYLKDILPNLNKKIVLLQKVLLDVAIISGAAVLPGYTHLQHGQTVLLSHHFLAYIEMLARDKERFEDALKRLKYCPLGSAALAGTSLPIDRFYVAQELGFEAPSRNSMDTVADRDILIEVLSHVSILGMHLSRMSEEFIIWQTKEFSFIEVDEKYSTGSSAMPQKRNPDSIELIRGKASRFIGNLVTLLTLLKSLPLTYNRDLQEDKVPVFDSLETAHECLLIMGEVIKTAKFNYYKMESSVIQDGSVALDLAEYLVQKGMPFRQAYHLIGEVVLYAEKNNTSIERLSVEELRNFSKLFDEEVEKRQKSINSPRYKKSYGSTSPKEVTRQINYWKKKLGYKIK